MDIKDVKVDMTVQINNNARYYVGYIGTVQSVDYTAKTATLKLEGLNKPWIVSTYQFDEYLDTEADMVVWDALEVGEHFISVLGNEAVKVNDTQYAMLGGTKLLTRLTPPLYKYKLA